MENEEKLVIKRTRVIRLNSRQHYCTIPSQFMRSMNLDKGDTVEWHPVDSGGVILRKQVVE